MELWRDHEQDISSTWEYLGAIKSTFRDRDIIFCRFGRLTKSERQKYLRPDMGERRARVAHLENLVKGLTDDEIAATISTIDGTYRSAVAVPSIPKTVK